MSSVLYVPCLDCRGKGHWFDKWNGNKVVICTFCLGDGKHEVSQDEYNEFWKNYKESEGSNVSDNTVDYDAWAEELQKSKIDLIELLQSHTEMVKEIEQLKAEKQELSNYKYMYEQAKY